MLLNTYVYIQNIQKILEVHVCQTISIRFWLVNQAQIQSSNFSFGLVVQHNKT